MLQIRLLRTSCITLECFSLRPFRGSESTRSVLLRIREGGKRTMTGWCESETRRRTNNAAVSVRRCSENREGGSSVHCTAEVEKHKKRKPTQNVSAYIPPTSERPWRNPGGISFRPWRRRPPVRKKEDKRRGQKVVRLIMAKRALTRWSVLFWPA